jgi:4-hydroxy-3-polyprenylbenzoate decarboxylase
MTIVPERLDMDMPVEGVFHNLVIAKIQKEYAGQAQKVMNAMWGAGQMMFNKILVVASSNISDYKTLALEVFKNMNPATDIYFSQGPMDVLDHSCSKLGFGGKMCIDGTVKYDEEKEDIEEIKTIYNKEELLQKYPEIVEINDTLINENISCVIISVKKKRVGHIKELHNEICSSILGIKMILYVEHTVNAHDLPVALWRFCNNVDPRRDNILVRQVKGACMGFDGTIKTKELDNFQRDWPNIIVANKETIKSVDAKWLQLNIGEFISSPSLKFEDQMYGEEAVANVSQ